MEWLWYIIAALGAGVGTGLAGLSAATVMVPILIVLCPSFSGQTGAYQATAIALASDILSSAVTTWTYARHRNIDLRRGWIMMACILAMSTVGSYVALIVGNVVLGSFTLCLTFFIGIRFLVKHNTSRKDPAAKGEKLDWKGVAISLFFGLTIGFGTGFVGTGGGYVTGMAGMVHFSRGEELAKRFGAVVLSPEYRLAGRARYPAALEDCYAALKYMSAHALEMDDIRGVFPVKWKEHSACIVKNAGMSLTESAVRTAARAECGRSCRTIPVT